uniref:Uncharacterized protein n=1 Tax=viral metagenome TaxID=1070528 RepID=A0A6M3LH58_9ZZZZ
MTYEQIDKFIELMEDSGNMYSCKEGFAFYFKLNGYWLELLWESPHLLLNHNIINILLKQSGEHIHFIGVYAQNKENNLQRHSKEVMSIDYKAMRRAIKEIIKREHPKSISWYNRDLTRLIYRRIKNG